MRRSSSEDDLDHDGDGYWHAARRPLQILAFLLPLIIAYELCLAVVLPSGDGADILTVQAHRSLLWFFGVFGIAPTGGLFLGGVVIAVVLLCWHVLARERWSVDVRVAGLMGVEAIALALPLLVLGHLVANLAAATPTTTSFADLDVLSQMAISVGAGLYEELVFRMVLIALVDTLLVDLAGLSTRAGAAVAIVVSAVAFTFYHDLSGPGGVVSTVKLAFYFLAGLYFGAVFVLRGFGLVVGAHAVYDILTVLLAAATRA
ncbi:MAG: CPBP family intramembrane metalloprotease [Phycisphaerales bacterium]|nr:CPBP family intramembrane metalloprotease [Phycisphaerae bacterium]NNM25788.1 CPBP family intramembrane metalloprotease [Phycisphaerales bacterium]